jgi:gamma-glutamyl:cysteine ligase YbdK (ATP-grasp superfamily)
VGQEVTEAHYRKRDFQAFSQRLAEETSQLLSWVEQKRFSHQWRAGFELEAWLVDANLQPTPKNVEFLQVLDDSLVVPELSRFNFELNNESAPLQGNFLANFQQELGARWARCWEAASSLESAPVLIGTLPTLRAEQLTLENMSPMQRYRALNEQVLRIREGRPLQIAIKGEESLQLMHQDVMFEAATTSLQVHLQVPVEDAARVLNASMILSAPLVAAAANSPFLFGHALWEETRIPVFEQSVALTTDHDPERRFARVGFGSGYVTQGLESFFVENFENFAPLLPMQFEETASLPHLRLHNGTIWRWNRPLLGFDEDGCPHWRIEQRVMSAGPSLVDSMANSALFFGAALSYAAELQPMETRLAFRDARANFYAAAREGLKAQVRIPGGKLVLIADWLLEDLIPRARQALAQVGADADDWLDVIEMRVRSSQTGSAWQRAWVRRHGRDWSGLTATYLENQRSERPVHAWSI